MRCKYCIDSKNDRQMSAKKPCSYVVKHTNGILLLCFVYDPRYVEK